MGFMKIKRQNIISLTKNIWLWPCRYDGL